MPRHVAVGLCVVTVLRSGVCRSGEEVRSARRRGGPSAWMPALEGFWEAFEITVFFAVRT